MHVVAVDRVARDQSVDRGDPEQCLVDGVAVQGAEKVNRRVFVSGRAKNVKSYGVGMAGCFAMFSTPKIASIFWILKHTASVMGLGGQLVDGVLTFFSASIPIWAAALELA